MSGKCCTCGKKKAGAKCPNLSKLDCEDRKKAECCKDKEEPKKNEECCDEPKEGCPEFQNPKRLLSKRVHRVKCFAEMMSDEKCFIKFCKRLHIVIATCLYTWVLMLACLLENINWIDAVRLMFCSIRQNATLEHMLDGLRVVECKLLCSMAASYKPGAIWHYIVVLILLPIVGSIEIVSFKLAMLLKFKSVLFGERLQEPGEEPRMITSTECSCVTEEYVPTPRANFCAQLLSAEAKVALEISAVPETAPAETPEGEAEPRPSQAAAASGEARASATAEPRPSTSAEPRASAGAAAPRASQGGTPRASAARASTARASTNQQEPPKDS